MQFKDYYETLGVKPDATDAEIKRAYRKLARKYHPDVSKEAGAEDKIKAVNEAYEALKDAERRREYDQLRAGGYRAGDEFRPAAELAGRTSGGGDGGFQETDFSDFFESVFGRGGGARAQGAAGPRRGSDLQARIQIDLQSAFTGGRERITLRDPVQGERTLEVKIPAGIEPGRQIRLSGQGNPGVQGGPAGDLLLEVGVREDSRFQLEGRNIVVGRADHALGSGARRDGDRADAGRAKWSCAFRRARTAAASCVCAGAAGRASEPGDQIVDARDPHAQGRDRRAEAALRDAWPRRSISIRGAEAPGLGIRDSGFESSSDRALESMASSR